MFWGINTNHEVRIFVIHLLLIYAQQIKPFDAHSSCQFPVSVTVLPPAEYQPYPNASLTSILTQLSPNPDPIITQS